MDAHVPDCLVVDYESLIPGLALPDPDDRHVLAAAIHAGASHIVTFNIIDFPSSILKEHRIIAQHPDQFFMSLIRDSADDVCLAVRRQRQSLHSPPKTAEDLLRTLEALGLKQTVGELRRFLELL